MEHFAARLQVGRGGCVALNPYALQSAHDDPQVAIGEFEQFDDVGGGADVVQMVRRRLLHGGVLLHHQAKDALLEEDGIHQPPAGRATHHQRYGHARIDHGVFQRQDRQLRRNDRFIACWFRGCGQRRRIDLVRGQVPGFVAHPP